MAHLKLAWDIFASFYGISIPLGIAVAAALRMFRNELIVLNLFTYNNVVVLGTNSGSGFDRKTDQNQRKEAA